MLAAIMPGTLAAQENSRKDVFNEVSITEIHSHNNNPWGLVYADAITENVAGYATDSSHCRNAA